MMNDMENNWRYWYDIYIMGDDMENNKKPIDVEKLEHFRKAHGETPREFAKRIGVSHWSYYKWISNTHPGLPSLKTLGRIAHNLGVTTRDLVR
jgi:DNA-binding XRE family transcriptional regulator